MPEQSFPIRAPSVSGTQLDRTQLAWGASIVGAALATAGFGLLAGAAPKYAIVGVLALAFIPLAVKRYTLATAVFMVSTFIDLSGSAQKGIGFILILVGLGSLGSHAGSKPNFFAEHKRMTALILAYLAWVALGIVWADSTADVIDSLYRYVPNFLVFFVVYAAVRDRRDGTVLAASFVVGATVAAAAAIVMPAQSFDGVARAGGFIGDPNELAAELVAGLALAVAFSCWRSITWFGRALALVAAAMCLVGIVLSVSRGGLIALAFTLCAGVCVAGRWRPALALGAGVAALSVIGYFAILAPQSARQRLSISADNSSGRAAIWKVGWREVQNHPLTGVGGGNFSVAGTQYVLEPGFLNDFAPNYQGLFVDRLTPAHNTFLEVLAEGGVPGLLMFLGLLAAALGCAYRAALRFRATGDDEMEVISYGVICGTLGYLAACFFLSEVYSKQLYLLLALGPVLLSVARRGPSAVAARVRAG